MKKRAATVRFIFFFLWISLCLGGASFAERISVSANSASARTGPGVKYEIVWDKLDRNYPLVVLDRKDDWYYVKDYENDKGWINKSFVDSHESVITKKDSINVRSGPGAQSNIVFKVDRGVPFKVLKRNGSWIEIQHSDGDSGWISSQLVW